MICAGDTIENPITGERVTFLKTAADTDGEMVVIDTTVGQTTLDSLRVVDWAMAELKAGPEVVAGGVPMGGDVAVALAGIDERVTRVAYIVASS